MSAIERLASRLHNRDLLNRDYANDLCRCEEYVMPRRFLVTSISDSSSAAAALWPYDFGCTLKTDYIDIYQFHNPAFCPKPGDGSGLYEAMLEAKAQGEIRHIGMLLSLGRKELEKLRDEDPHCEVVCHFCHTKYEFDLNKLVKKAVEKAAPASENAEN